MFEGMEQDLEKSFSSQIDEEVRIANEAQLRIWKEEAEREAELAKNKKAPPPPASEKSQPIILSYEPPPAPKEPVRSIKPQEKASPEPASKGQDETDLSGTRAKTEKDRMDAIRFGKQMILEKLIEIRGNISKLSPMRIEDEIDAILKMEGIEPIEALSQTFNPYLHEAVETIETKNPKEDNLVLQEVEKGYVLDGRLFKPAKVKIGKIKK